MLASKEQGKGKGTLKDSDQKSSSHGRHDDLVGPPKENAKS